MRYIVLLLALVLSNYCLSGTIDPKVSDEKYLEYGEQHKCVLKLYATSKDGDKSILNHGVCTLVGPQIAITSAHILWGSTGGYVLDNNGQKVKIEYAVYPQAFEKDLKAKRGLSKNDIAVCLLSNPINIEHYPEIYGDKDEEGKVCSIAGFGLTGTHQTGTINEDMKKRAGSNIIDLVEDGMLECSLNKGKRTSLEFLIAPGDSGGGLFIDQKLAGINCGVYTLDRDKKLNSDYKDKSVHVRISEHKSWIDSIIGLIDKIESDKEKQNGHR